MTVHLSTSAAGAAPRRACMLAYTFYETDGRVMRYAEALARDGTLVDAIVLRRPGQPREETVNGVRVLRVQERTKNETGKFSHLQRLLRFFFRSMAEVTLQHMRRPYQLVHVHSVPDFQVFAALVPKLTGARLILDIHDIVPEFYAAKFGTGERSLVFRALRRVEQLSAAFADHVIVSNHLWMERIAMRSAPRDKCSAFINYPDMSVFHEGLRTRVEGDGRFIAIYPGTLNHHQGLDIALRAMQIVAPQAPKLELHVYGEGPCKQQLIAQARELGLQSQVRFHSPLPLREIAAVMADADLGIVPKRNDAFGGDAFSTKVLEFMALGVPLIVAATRVDRHYFNESLLRFFEPGDADALALQLLAAYRFRDESMRRAQHALSFALANSWDRRQVDYLQVVRGLIDAKS